MGLFRNKKRSQKNTSTDNTSDAERYFFDEYYREELRNHGRWYFEQVISENATLFKQDLEKTVAQVNTELNEHITKQLDSSIAEIETYLKIHATQELDEEFSQSLKNAQDLTMQSLDRNVKAAEEQHKQLSEKLQHTFDDNTSQMEKIKAAQDSALDSINKSAEAVKEQHEKLAQMLQQNVANQEEMMIKAFEENMSRIVEHYLLGALGDQFDLKAQLPAIIQQMEENKQAIVDDMKL